MPATCVPWPWSSYGVVRPPTQSRQPTMRPASCSWFGSIPVSMMQIHAVAVERPVARGVGGPRGRHPVGVLAGGVEGLDDAVQLDPGDRRDHGQRRDSTRDDRAGERANEPVGVVRCQLQRRRRAPHLGGRGALHDDTDTVARTAGGEGCLQVVCELVTVGVTLAGAVRTDGPLLVVGCWRGSCGMCQGRGERDHRDDGPREQVTSEPGHGIPFGRLLTRWDAARGARLSRICHVPVPLHPPSDGADPQPLGRWRVTRPRVLWPAPAAQSSRGGTAAVPTSAADRSKWRPRSWARSR